MTEPGPSRPARVPSPGAAAMLLVGVGLLFVFGGVVLQLLLGEAGLLLAQVCFLLLPTLLLIRLRGYDLTRTLSLRMPTRGQLVGGTLLLVGGLQLALVLAWLQGLFMPVPVEYLDAMSDMLRAESPGRFAWLLILAALTPAVAEEVLFRGVLLSSLRDRLPALAAVVLVGLVFGMFHLTPQTAFRFLPTAWLGMLLAWIVVASGSLPLAILLHFLNNASVLALTAIPFTDERLNQATPSEPPLVLGILGVLLLIWGYRIMRGPTAPTRIGSTFPE